MTTSPHAFTPDTSPFPKDHPKVAFGRIGVLIVNLGTPEGTDYWSMRAYLKEFLSDRRVIEVNRIVWWFVLNAIVLTKRPGPKGKDYASIWNNERDEGPLKTITRDQAEKLAAHLAGRDPRIVVDWAMRYGKPPIAERIAALQAQGCERILIVPLYPQYSAATTATVCDKAFDALKAMRWQPIIRVAPPWHDDPVYIDQVAASLEQHLAALDFEPEVILASFHGVPKSYLLKGDPYHCQCAKTARLLRDRLGMSEEKLRLTFQSRFGTEEWLQPYTDMTVKALAEGGVKRLAIFNPGFVADCLETLEEIGGENREIFLHHGGEKFAAIPCLNATPEGMRVLEAVVERELKGWVG
ncbi:ferrochelatase [Xanthobacter tagetidis]|uniref:Ferrochelatase n=1 Tax=Xanthobacter tagetidis TaxID=60216 RepID=A0A3L7AQE2_9HYPH|nr:ferrochelatase [Xanthobacter tagetidis]MBB6308261.1 ferrochelatase [Xanthobacter tagetidis]RLP81871.1 ferrochelatase [Xanthobacter tagetidis]